MTASAGNLPGRIFMSYRREDTAYPAGWLYERLVGHFARSQIFKDIDSIELGDDFFERITTEVGSCDVLLALIGDRWLTATGQDGRRRLDNPDDVRPVGNRSCVGTRCPRHPHLGGRGPDAPRRRAAGKPFQAGAPAGT